MGAQAVRLSNVDINNALENKDFEVLFQPIFDLGNGGLARMETFVRWRHAKLGVLPPGAFISFFESQGRMGELTRYVLDVALDAYADWRGPYAPGFSINLALTDLSDEAFAPHLTKALRDRDFPSDLITLECPMPPVDADMDATLESFQRLQKTGARLAIEVRGRANDFLRNADPFPFDEIKTGGSSILRFARTVRGPGLSAISDLLDIAKNANAITTAVGVEDQASLSALRGLGFTAAQGNHLAKVGDIKDFRPGRVNEVRELLELDPLGSDDLSALFRTHAPSPKTATPSDDNNETQNEDIVDRLNARVEQSQDDAPASDKDKEATAEAEHKAEVRERARKKAKALALAKRAKARDARKVAAIKRAKAKVAMAREEAEDIIPGQQKDQEDAAFPPSEAPRVLQDRLAKEFNALAREEDEINAELSSDDSASDPAHEEDTLDAPDQPIDVKPDALDEDDEIAKAVDVAVEDVPSDAAPTPTQKQDSPPELRDQLDFNNINLQGGGFVPQKKPQPAKPTVPQHKEQLSLPIGKANAHFRPGILVSGTPATINDGFMGGRATPADHAPDTPVETTQENQATPQDESSFFEADVEQPSVAEPSEDSTDIVSEMIAEAKRAELAKALLPEDQGTLYTGDEEELDAVTKPSVSSVQKQKSFLSRRYKIIPTHFWPKPWVRAVRRMSAR